MCPVRARLNSSKEKQTAKANTFMFNKLVIEIAVTCYIFKIMAHKRKF